MVSSLDLRLKRSWVRISAVPLSVNNLGQVVHTRVPVSSSSIPYFGTGQGAVMPCGWGGNRRSGVALAMCHRLQRFIHLRAHGLRKGDEHPAYSPHWVWHSVIFLLLPFRLRKVLRMVAELFCAWHFLNLQSNYYCGSQSANSLPPARGWRRGIYWRHHGNSCYSRRAIAVKGKDSPYSITERRVLELIAVLGSQPAGDVSRKPGGRLPLLSARPAVTPRNSWEGCYQFNFAAWWT